MQWGHPAAVHATRCTGHVGKPQSQGMALGGCCWWARLKAVSASARGSGKDGHVRPREVTSHPCTAPGKASLALLAVCPHCPPAGPSRQAGGADLAPALVFTAASWQQRSREALCLPKPSLGDGNVGFTLCSATTCTRWHGQLVWAVLRGHPHAPAPWCGCCCTPARVPQGGAAALAAPGLGS